MSNHLVYFSGGDLDAASKSIMGIAMNDNDENVHLLVVVRIFFNLIFACHNDTNKNFRYIKKAWKGGVFGLIIFSYFVSAKCKYVEYFSCSKVSNILRSAVSIHFSKMVRFQFDYSFFRIHTLSMMMKEITIIIVYKQTVL